MAKERPDLKPYVGQKLTVIAWLWARTVKSPNPAFAQVDVPLASTFMLSTKAGKEAYVEPVIENGGYRFTVKVGKPKDAEAAKNGTKLARGANFQCLMSGTPIAGDYIKAEGKAGRMGARLMAIVAEGERGRVYLAPTPEHGGRRAQGEAGVEAGRRDAPSKPRGFSTSALRHDDVRRPLHRPPARGADDLLRPGAGSARAGAARRPRRRPARRRQASRATAALARRPTPMRWRCIWRLQLSKATDVGSRSYVGDRAETQTYSMLSAGKRFRWFGTLRKRTRFCDAAGNFDAAASTGSRRCLKRLAAGAPGCATQADAADAVDSVPARSSPPIRPTTTTSATPTCRTSSTSGCAARCRPSSRPLRHARRA